MESRLSKFWRENESRRKSRRIGPRRIRPPDEDAVNTEIEQISTQALREFKCCVKIMAQFFIRH